MLDRFQEDLAFEREQERIQDTLTERSPRTVNSHQPRRCIICGTQFLPKHRVKGRQQLVCSQKCFRERNARANRQLRARKKGDDV